MIDLKKAKVVYKKSIENAKTHASCIAQSLGCEFLCIEDITNDASILIVIGGDGTILKCAKYASKFDIPVFGFNMGRLGFLSQADLKEKDAVLEKLKNGDYRIEKRLMLTDEKNNIALNDIVIKSGEFAKAVELELLINDKPVCSYLADGLIISTPTGSTAYNLSAGGAVIAPVIECITIVPICAHTLSARPIVVSADDIIQVKLHSKTNFQLISDGVSQSIEGGSVTIKKHSKKAPLLLLNSKNKDFYDVLRTKLHWGVAPKA